jgi:hypothetical protein
MPLISITGAALHCNNEDLEEELFAVVFMIDAVYHIPEGCSYHRHHDR